MPRRARLHLPSGIYHLISRCLDGRKLLDGAPARARYLDLLGRSLARTDARLLAWCIMSNHVHLVVRAGEEPLSRLMKAVHTGYAQWKNRVDGRIGPVFADRYKSILVDADAYLFELIRYVHLNPVRAGLVAHPDHSERSSHRCYIGEAKAPAWLEVDGVLELFDRRPGKARLKYASFIDDGLDEHRRSDLMGEAPTAELEQVIDEALRRGLRLSHPVLGSPEFVEQVFATLEKTSTFPLDARKLVKKGPKRQVGLRELVAATCVILEVEDEAFASRPKAKGPRDARKIITWLWVHHFGGRQAELARHLNVGTDLVSRWHGRAVDDFEALEASLDRVLASLPRSEPILAARPTDQVVFRLEMTDP